MFGLDPLSRPVAIIEILLLLSLAAFIGWLLARLLFNGRINALQTAIADKEAALDVCRQTKLSAVPTVVPTPRPKPTYIAPDPAPVTGFTAAAAPPEPTIAPLMVEPMAPPPTVDSEAAVLARVAARSRELNFDRIGMASVGDADDLKAIVGVGPFLERKLHAIGIYTFRQIANFTKEDIDRVNDIIEFFPGRIERDNWVSQAKEFYTRKYGA